MARLVQIGVPGGESVFFDLPIVSRSFLLRRFGRGLGDACGLAGDRSFFFMVVVVELSFVFTKG
jgi:hypothetical protein